MAKYLVTTGISLRESSRCWQNVLTSPPPRDYFKTWGELRTDSAAFAGVLKRQQEEVRELLRELGNDATNYSAAARRATAARFNMDAWRETKWAHCLPAEIATLRRMAQKGVFKDGDEIVFLGGTGADPWEANVRDTDPCGNLKDAYLCWAIMDRVSAESKTERGKSDAAHRPAWILPEELAINIDITQGPMDPVRTDEFVKLISLPSGYHTLPLREKSAASEQCLTTKYKTYHLVLTGGYKAVLIALAVCAGALNADTEIYYLHERGKEVVHLKLRSLLPTR